MRERRFFAYALNDKRPNAEEHPPFPPFKGGKSEAKGEYRGLKTE